MLFGLCVFFLASIDGASGADFDPGVRAELPLLLTVNRDGTFSAEIDRDALPEALRSFVRVFRALCSEVLDRTAKEAGVSRFAFEVMFLMKQGMSTDAYMLQVISDDLLGGDLSGGAEARHGPGGL